MYDVRLVGSIQPPTASSASQRQQSAEAASAKPGSNHQTAASDGQSQDAADRQLLPSFTAAALAAAGSAQPACCSPFPIAMPHQREPHMEESAGQEQQVTAVLHAVGGSHAVCLQYSRLVVPDDRRTRADNLPAAGGQLHVCMLESHLQCALLLLEAGAAMCHSQYLSLHCAATHYHAPTNQNTGSEQVCILDA